MNKGTRLLALGMIIVFTCVLVSCSQNSKLEPTAGSTSIADEPLKIVNLVNGTLGDKSFFDSSNEGMNWIKEKYGDRVIVKTVEMTYDESKWAPMAADICTEDWDIVIAGTWHMVETIMELSKQYPDKHFWLYDEGAYYDEQDWPNIYSMIYKQNEASFLVGMVAGGMTKTNKVSFLGGMDDTIINDFLVGYVEGVHYVNPDCEVIVSYIGNYSDSPKGKEITTQFFNQGVDVNYGVAGQAGLGQFDAVMEAGDGHWVIGVDADQAMVFAETEPKKAEKILTSGLKNVNYSFLRAMDLHMEGKLPYGQAEKLRIVENAVGIADNEYYQKLVPEELREKVAKAKQDIIDGTIVVPTAIGMDIDTLETYR